MPMRRSETDVFRQRAGENFPECDPLEESDSDSDDPGGDDYLDTRDDKATLKLKRTFEVEMRSGSIIRFEV
jgi:hypothetical protein